MWRRTYKRAFLDLWVTTVAFDHNPSEFCQPNKINSLAKKPRHTSTLLIETFFMCLKDNPKFIYLFNIVSVHCREEECIKKYIPWGPRDFPRAGILHPEARETARGQSRGPRGAKSPPEGNLEGWGGCISQCIPTRGSVRPFSQHKQGSIDFVLERSFSKCTGLHWMGIAPSKLLVREGFNKWFSTQNAILSYMLYKLYAILSYMLYKLYAILSLNMF